MDKSKEKYANKHINQTNNNEKKNKISKLISISNTQANPILLIADLSTDNLQVRRE